MTVDGVLRCFSISKRKMVAQYKLSDLLRSRGEESLLQGPEGLLCWFQGAANTLSVRARVPRDSLTGSAVIRKPFFN